MCVLIKMQGMKQLSVYSPLKALNWHETSAPHYQMNFMEVLTEPKCSSETQIIPQTFFKSQLRIKFDKSSFTKHWVVLPRRLRSAALIQEQIMLFSPDGRGALISVSLQSCQRGQQEDWQRSMMSKYKTEKLMLIYATYWHEAQSVTCILDLN